MDKEGNGSDPVISGNTLTKEEAIEIAKNYSSGYDIEHLWDLGERWMISYKKKSGKRLPPGLYPCLVDPKNHRAFGFCIIDLPGNYADETMAENVAYELIEGIHNSSTNKVAIIEACLLTEETQRALKIPQGILPPATCWIGLAVHDSILWQQIENNKNLQIRLALSYDITKQ